MMKIKNPYIAIVAIFILAISVYSCRKDFLPEEIPIAQKAEWAKDYFKESLLPNEGNTVDPYQYVGNTLRANLMSKKKDNMKIPIWQQAMYGKTTLYDVIEVPLKYTNKVTPMLYIHQEGQGVVKTANKELLKASLDRLVIYKDKKGKINQRIISFIPTEQYLARHNGDISHNRSNKLDKDFDGTLIYREWNGAFLFALIIKDGKAIKKLSLQNKTKFRQTTFRSGDCEYIDIYEWFQDCYYVGDNPVPYYCSEPYSEYVTTIEVCPPGDDPCLEPENYNTVECGGGEEEVNCSNIMGELTGTEVSVNEGSTVLETLPTTRKKEYVWKYLQNLLWYYVSAEEGVHKKVGSEWQWDTLTHKRVYREGTVIGGTLTMTINTHIPTIGTYNAGMSLNYDFKGEAVCKGSPLEYTRNNVSQNSPVWNVNDF